MILVTGATGLNGKELLRLLSARGVAVRALVRNPARAQAITALPHVEIVQGDMAHPETLVTALRGIDRAMLISSSDPAMLDVQSNFIDAARQAQLAAGMPPYLADALFELFAERRNGKEAKVWSDAAALLGRPPTSFDKFARRNAAVFRGEAPPPKI